MELRNETRVASRSVYNTGVCCILVCDRSPVLTSGRETATATRLPTRPAKPSRATRLFDRQRSRCRPQGQRLRLWVCVDRFCLDRRKEENEEMKEEIEELEDEASEEKGEGEDVFS